MEQVDYQERIADIKKRIDREKYVLNSNGYICHYNEITCEYHCYEKYALYNAVRFKIASIIKKHGYIDK
jgi:hypothetical protein